MELVYETPESVSTAGLSSLTLTVPHESVKTLWDSVNKVCVHVWCVYMSKYPLPPQVDTEGGEGTRKTADQRETFLKALTGYLVELFHLKMEVLH